MANFRVASVLVVKFISAPIIRPGGSPITPLDISNAPNGLVVLAAILLVESSI